MPRELGELGKGSPKVISFSAAISGRRRFERAWPVFTRSREMPLAIAYAHGVAEGRSLRRWVIALVFTAGAILGAALDHAIRVWGISW